jgi:hypothetical protein
LGGQSRQGFAEAEAPSPARWGGFITDIISNIFATFLKKWRKNCSQVKISYHSARKPSKIAILARFPLLK